MPSTPKPGRVVAVTGACTYLGGELLRRLEEDPHYARVLALDVRPPPVQGHKIEFVNLDLTQPTVDGELATLLQRHQVDTFVHGAFLSHPTHAAEWAHELEDVGTMHVLNACAHSAAWVGCDRNAPWTNVSTLWFASRVARWASSVGW